LETAEKLQQEAGTALSKFEAADNVDMNLIMNEYEAYYELRFDKKPKIVRKLKDGEESSVKIPPSSRVAEKRPAAKPSAANREIKPPKTATVSDEVVVPLDAGLGVTGLSVNGPADKKPTAAVDDGDRIEHRLLKPPPQLGSDPEMRALAAVICREIYQDSPNVRFDDIVQLTEAKRLLCEAVQLPLQYPSIFTGLLRPWKGILLHGPPGTGKTMLAKAVATECRTTFFNISASTLVSKWRGDSEKLVRVLFDVARYHAPSTIFFDEIDSILNSRGGEGSEHEASRRMKTELLMQMDGLRSRDNDQQVFVMAASNLPWDLDVAVLRRLEKRVLVGLPEVVARELMLRLNLKGRVDDGSIDFGQISRKTEGYSGADIELLCREAAMRPVRRLMAKLSEISLPPPQQAQSGKQRTTASSNSRVVITEPAVNVESLLRSDPVSTNDVEQALLTTKRSSDGSMGRYTSWQSEYGSV
ncbi:unnamed protein product, partial [Ectocarpus fasciculatus]